MSQADSDCMWLDVLAVDPKHQKKGIGRLLLDYTEDFMKARENGNVGYTPMSNLPIPKKSICIADMKSTKELW